ncbi:hypothetical protein B2I23_05090 [Candidatus Liberibacter asiaticus]|uniref:Uncharacterized protein n=2 Tax=Liberibacter asiaticus TaxID=34021 RepID=C6XGU5_LIBAP|nr:hypothetical protein CLIBASIA_05135 [Candidatus Liberibacter asiaticus str. psy62]AGH17361.1 hypothetical protein WSI_04965 [Candidatus Liberibacter asiaticus str. gxpsy]ALK07642.1 hypothetical protein CD16_05025 [Candidatus Liberibacter asiaticus]BAP26894.1 hypothetical protein CGUJ_05132 [Candidatus Liberibacter asiaticus str. Ishi-1]ASK53134.1 hypothetical protein B2I23_05090 [Candidatus Liberibacter asiaticus]
MSPILEYIRCLNDPNRYRLSAKDPHYNVIFRDEVPSFIYETLNIPADKRKMAVIRSYML